jgi:ribosome-binding factor A
MGRRPERLAEGIREEVAHIVSSELKDPRLGFITITRVEVTHDLGLARVLVSVLGDETERQRSMAALQSATGFVRREIGRRLRIRVVPEIEFRYDKGIDATDRVARLLEEQHVGGNAGTAAAPAGEAGAPGRDASGVGDDTDADEEQDDEPTGSR